MPVTGPKPKSTPKQNLVVAHDWTEVENRPFTGKRPVSLPRYRRIDAEGRMAPQPWEPLTKTWWRIISSMPHCSLWSPADWMFAVDTAVVADNAHRGSTPAAGELRQRERILGTTIDARRDLRIRYVAKVSEPKVAIVPSSVRSIDDRRRRSTEGDGAS